MDATNATLTPVATLAATPVNGATYSTEEQAARRAAGRIEAAKRLAMLAHATKLATLARSAARSMACGDLTGRARKEAGKAWSDADRAAVVKALDGAAINATLVRVGKRILLTALQGDVAIRGDVAVSDVADRDPRTVDVSGLSVSVKLTAKLVGSGKRKGAHAGFAVSAVGLCSAGFRLGLKGTVAASPFVRVVATAL